MHSELVKQGFVRVSDSPKLGLECWNTKKPWDLIPNTRVTRYQNGRWWMSAVSGYRKVWVRSPEHLAEIMAKRAGAQ